MRALILVAGAAVALAACRNSDQAANTTNVDQTLAAGTIASNDVTAIDAVTGEDSNMAADVVLMNELDNLAAPATNGTGPKTKPPAARPSSARRAESRPATANAAEAATANNAL